ncbi:DEAD/DEAH box helicase [Desulfosoma caldarium]|uniref:SNF2 domain-containing protein n=1 Tax=Desulfosoma caldarium TaxID=610254 RepID=A0A3N1UY38_9BACT|nr:helicase-related protein [Desulfosoma caldarium]ROQ92176.1 SNF2 domain-containing protein [Desulfosoma caldarium]
MEGMNAGWYYSPDHGQVCQVIETQTLWGETTCRVWLPGRDSVVRISASRLKPLENAVTGSPNDIAYIAAAARVADVLTQELSACGARAGVLLAPIESAVIPLPHQIRALSRAMSGDRVRYLLADEVGLGKTIEAGLILRELKLRGLVKRTLVIAPKGLVTQWIAEMATHFGEQFYAVLSDDYRTLKQISAIHRTEGQGLRTDNERGNSVLSTPSIALHRDTGNPFQMLDQVVVSMDSVKPTTRSGGAAARERFEDLISAGWDLVIVDEAHRLGGSTDQVARFKLGQGLSEAAPYLLLLSATPHQGKTDAFHRLVSLLDAQEFPDVASVTRDRVQPYVIRTEKRRAIDAEGKPLFKPRRTQLAPVSWKERHRYQQLLYEAVTEYVREGYNQAIREKRSYIGFLMILMQRLVVSSTSAIKTALERRLAVLSNKDAGLSQRSWFNDDSFGQSSALSPEDFYDLDGQEQVDVLLRTRLKALKNERAEVKLLLDAAAFCEQCGPDAKAEALLEWLYRLQSEESDPELKVLVFTEFVPTQEMLRQFLIDRGFSVVCLNGSMDMEARKRVQDAFAKDARILISTDAGGEGLNLQFCHVVINYDIPWNPMRLEQRIGRVDRIGQTHEVRAVNFVFENSVEHRILEVLEEKLAVIFEEFGIDKTGDVLDSAQAGHMFDEMYLEAILNPEKVEESVESVVAHLQEQARQARTAASILGATEDLQPGEAQRLLSHPLPYWIETMTVSWLRSRGDALRGLRTESGKAKTGAEVIARDGKHTIWRLTWPDGHVAEGAFTHPSSLSRHASILGLDDPRIRALTMRLPRFTPGQPIPVVSIPGIPSEITGYWSLWQISILYDSALRSQHSALTRERRMLPLFLADNGRVYMPTARHIWDQLLAENIKIRSFLDPEVSHSTFKKLQNAAEEHGKPVYEALVQEYLGRIARERERADYAFAARRRTAQRIGLPQVRNYRLNLLAQEERSFHEQLDQKAHALPELSPLIVIRVESSGSYE